MRMSLSASVRNRRILAWRTEGAYKVFGQMYSYLLASTLLLVIFDGMVSQSRRAFEAVCTRIT